MEFIDGGSASWVFCVKMFRMIHAWSRHHRGEPQLRLTSWTGVHHRHEATMLWATPSTELSAAASAALLATSSIERGEALSD